MKSKEHWRNDLMCYAKRLTYDFETKIGWLFLPEHECCDMMGCINLFTGIDPGVEVIQTVAGERYDTEYRRAGKNDWSATLVVPPEARLFWSENGAEKGS